jgi:hypothetical protein
MDGSNYVRGAAAIDEANKQMAASGQLAGAQLAQQDVAAGNAGAALARLSRANVDGYASSSQFFRGVASLQTQMELGNVTTARASTTYAGLVNRFGMVADATAIAGKGNKDFAAVVDSVNQRVSLQTAGLDKAKVGTAQYSDQLRIIQGQLVAVAGNLGLAGTLLASFGGWGLAAAVGLGAVEKGFELVSAAADQLAGKAQQLNSFAIVTGLATEQIQALQETAAHFGLTSQDVGTFVDHFAAQLTTLRTATGPLYDLIRKIDPALAQQALTAKGTSAELGILAAAYRKAGEDAPALLKAAGGRTGMIDAPLIGAIGTAGGVEALTAAMDKASFLTAKETGGLQKLKGENDSLGEHIRNNVASIFSDAVLSNQVAARKELEGITIWMRGFSISGEWKTFTEWFDRKSGGLLSGLLGAPTLSAPVIPVVTGGALPDAVTPKESPQATANQYKEMVAALGGAASGYQHLHEKILMLNADLASGKITQDTYNRALAGANTEYTTQAINARIGALGMMASKNDIATQAQLKINKANLEGANINKTQAALIVEADQLKFAATKQNTVAQYGLVSETEMLNQKNAEYLNIARQLNLSNEQIAAGYGVVARNARAAYESSQVAASAHPQLTQLGFDAVNLDKQFDQFAVGGINSMTTALADISMGTKSAGDAFRNLGQVVIRSLEEMIIKMMIMKSLAPLLGGGGGFNILSLFGLGGTGGPMNLGNAGGTGGGLGGLYHSGGIVGSEPTAMRYVHPAYFDDAPRFHGGGIAGGEVPIIAQRGEGVFTPGQMAAMGGAKAPVIHIYPVAGSTMDSKTNSDGSIELVGRMIDDKIKSFGKTLPDRVAAITRDPRSR